jgi:hypothetical protein
MLEKWNSPLRNPAIPSMPFDLGTAQRTPVVLAVKLQATLMLELVEELVIRHHTINQNKSLQDGVLSLVIVVATQATVPKMFDALQMVKHVEVATKLVILPRYVGIGQSQLTIHHHLKIRLSR